VPSAFAAYNKPKICLSGLRRLRLARSPAPGQICNQPQHHALKFCSIYKMLWHPDSFVYRDSIVGAVGRRAGASFFARHLDYFIVTRNSQSLPGLGTITQLHRDPKLTTVYRDWQKTMHRDADGT
jgi:hypothetical protein